MKILILNGPNLNLLGTREPDVYGAKSMEEVFGDLVTAFPNIELIYSQSNVEGELVNILQEFGFETDGIVFNPGGYTHTSVALRDCISAIKTPVVEVHISNVHAREDFRRVSLIAPVCKGGIYGMGVDGYELAVRSFMKSMR